MAAIVFSFCKDWIPLQHCQNFIDMKLPSNNWTFSVFQDLNALIVFFGFIWVLLVLAKIGLLPLFIKVWEGWSGFPTSFKDAFQGLGKSMTSLISPSTQQPPPLVKSQFTATTDAAATANKPPQKPSNFFQIFFIVIFLGVLYLLQQKQADDIMASNGKYLQCYLKYENCSLNMIEMMNVTKLSNQQLATRQFCSGRNQIYAFGVFEICFSLSLIALGSVYFYKTFDKTWFDSITLCLVFVDILRLLLDIVMLYSYYTGPCTSDTLMEFFFRIS